MRLFSILIVCVFVLSSCATLLNSNEQDVRITSHPRISNVKVDTSNFLMSYEDYQIIKRSKKPLIIHCQLDSIHKTISVPRGFSKAWYWNLNPYAGYGIGFIFDRKTPRKYAYPSHIYLDAVDTTVFWHRFKPIKRGSVFIDFSIPYVNVFRTITNTNYYSTMGFMGLQGGIEVYYKKNKFISLHAGSVLDFPIPVPAPIHYSTVFQGTGANYLSLRNHFIKNTIEFGYGFCYTKSDWTMRDDSLRYYKRINCAVGPSLSVFWRRGNTYRIGFIYNSTLVLLNPKPEVKYAHLISFVFGWKIPVWQAK
ncbi:MAG: hypothetical protein IT236_14725 [Bacteroidia bacterium]|nr:hypothetical protein [Bacteroidia bacterium]